MNSSFDIWLSLVLKTEKRETFSILNVKNYESGFDDKGRVN